MGRARAAVARGAASAVEASYAPRQFADGVVQIYRLPRCAMFEADRYTLVVTPRRSGINPRPWGWEIYRDGQPLPARLRESGFRTEHTATLAGKVVLRDFLAGLAHEESKAD
jgi:hypothetical protein